MVNIPFNIIKLKLLWFIRAKWIDFFAEGVFPYYIKKVFNFCSLSKRWWAYTVYKYINSFMNHDTPCGPLEILTRYLHYLDLKFPWSGKYDFSFSTNISFESCVPCNCRKGQSLVKLIWFNFYFYNTLNTVVQDVHNIVVSGIRCSNTNPITKCDLPSTIFPSFHPSSPKFPLVGTT